MSLHPSKVLRARERAPTPYSSDVSTSNSPLSLSKSLGTRHFNSSSTSILFNNSISSSCLCLCSFLYASFSLTIHYSFSISLFVLILLGTPKLQKHTQLPTTNTNYFRQLSCFFFVLEHFICHIHFFIYLPSFNQCMIIKINTTHFYKFMCPLYHHVEALSIIIMNECHKFHLLITPHL